MGLLLHVGTRSQWFYSSHFSSLVTQLSHGCGRLWSYRDTDKSGLSLVLGPFCFVISDRVLTWEGWQFGHIFLTLNRHKHNPHCWKSVLYVMYSFFVNFRAWYSRLFLRRPPLLTLPPEILFDICLRLDCQGLLAVTQVQISTWACRGS